MFNGLAQWIALVGLNLRTLSQRRGSALSTIVGVACVVAVFVVLLSIAEGFRATMAATGTPDSVLVLRGGSESEMMSGLLVDATRIIADAPGVARSAAGPQASAELFVVVDLPKRSTGTDANVPLRGVQPAYRRGSTFQSMHALLQSPEAFTAFKDSLTQDPRLDVKVVRESEYYAEQSEGLTRLVRSLGGFITVLMALGAIFGALNTMYNAVASRTREIATLRALGFGRSPVVFSILAESLVISLVGAAIGGAVAYFGFNGFQTSTLNWQSFSQVAFAFKVTPTLLMVGIVIALAIGLIGGLLPAVRAARLPVATALREL